MYMEVTAGAISPPDTSATAPHADAAKVLQVDGLQTWFYTRRGTVKAVDNVSFHVRAGETLAIVGESGCGTSITALSVMRLIPSPPGRIVGGTVRLLARNMNDPRCNEMRPDSGHPHPRHSHKTTT